MIETSKNFDSYFIKIIEYLFIIYTLLINNSVYMYHSSYLHLFILVGWQVTLFFLCMESITNNNKRSIDIDKFYSFIFTYLIIILSILICYYLYHPFPLHDALLFSIDPVMIMILFYNQSYGKNNIDNSLFYKFERIMLILSCFSLVCYFLYLVNIPPIGFHVSYNWGHAYNLPSYFGLCFPPAPGEKIFLSSLRNVSIFTEGPVYSYVLCVALFIELFLHKHDDSTKYRLLILFITICSTQSTNGIILALLAFVLKQAEMGLSLIKKLILFIASPIFLIIIINLIKRKVSISDSSAVVPADVVNSSYHIRMDNVIASLRAWKDNIIFGNGIENKECIYKYINPLRFNGGDLGITSSFFEALAYGGILLALFYIIPMILTLKIAPNIRDFAIINFMYFIVEGLMKYYIFYIIIAYCISCYLLYKSKNRINFNRS